MDSKDHRTLQILEEIGRNHSFSQRDMAKKLNISLGLVNSFIKRLANKGYCKITSIPKNRVKYILTPKGATEKTRLTYEYIHYSYQFYKGARHKLRELFHELTSQGVRRIVFYGANDFAEIAYISLQESPIEMVAVVDDLENGKKFLHRSIMTPEELGSLFFDKILITAVSEKDTILKKIMEKGIPQSKIVML